ncbi:NAD(P)-dependent dehydrogenase (short-subunit alcohol dehydrogenase family) [Paenibacillus sp. V4I3]|uniref:SDR family NAD(P)-dependent oxidoreductase n=1 Tax=unclassified Paenibacillus TaxID=185978 RepID=UPI00277F94EF|nr:MULTISPECIES: glucose 1-dehydrogenase [unclassified Paenibacillus]MDQ0875460.1 NAD(P)-dependent dehydrogenase (short-subunit alcohol dehydrogenase family) [Paenibacillus sp. V4I3]MDQ0888458.1 NAD(P)-dependent dehydrogenase (short-subunit alcohol dehydrogenase family) [Paenibacillus sp. V4I9]
MFLPSFQLHNKIALVTGAGRGIGRALAIGLAEAGADVALFARTASDIEEVAHEIRALGRKAYPFTVDVTNREQIEEAVQQIIEQSGRLDILVNNAGMNIRSQALAVTDEEWDTIMQTNLKSAFLCSQIVGRHMQQKEYGRIINIASVAGQVALRTGVVYAATKAAMIQMTKVLALEWGKYGINVNSIGPWYFKTPLTEKILANPEYLAEIIARTPLGRVGELEELVGPAVFLASDAANYVTGQTLFVDGGMTIYGF